MITSKIESFVGTLINKLNGRLNTFNNESLTLRLCPPRRISATTPP
jgi:hypothetical protein